MTDREKLVELLAQACEWGDRCIGCKNNLPIAATCKEERFGKAADHLIANGMTVHEWISVEDRLPEADEYVLCFCTDVQKKRWHTVGCVRSRNGLWELDIDPDNSIIDEVTHWMPLPEPPKESEK